MSTWLVVALVWLGSSFPAGLLLGVVLSAADRYEAGRPPPAVGAPRRPR